MAITSSVSQHARQHRIAVSVFFFVAGCTFASWASRIPHIQAQLHLNEAQLGAVLFALPIGLLVSSFVIGNLVARFGSKTMLHIAATSYSLVLLCLGLANATWQLVLCLFFFGIAGNMFNVSVNTQAIGVEKLYGRSIMASFHGTWSLAGFSGAAIGTIMIWLQLLPWQHFLFISAAGLVASSVFVSKTLMQAGSGQKKKGFAWPDKKLLQLGLIAFGNLVCEGTMFDWSGVYFKKVVMAPASLTTLGYAAFMACMATGRFLADRIVMRIGSRRMLQYAGILIALGFLLSTVFPSVVMATMGFMLVGFGVSSVVPIVYSQAGQTKKMHPGQALASVTTIGFAGFLAGPPIIGFVAQATSLRWSFVLVAVIGLSTSILAATLPRKAE
ncbi:MAG TPA: MFS transporter [Phnomibacter sp.]|nr:MFS transporter [Phnomibacter sp.]